MITPSGTGNYPERQVPSPVFISLVQADRTEMRMASQPLRDFCTCPSVSTLCRCMLNAIA